MILNVQPIEGELFRFYVDSRSRPDAPHLVDLESYKWGGQCDCEAFKFKHEPALSRGADGSDLLRCSHIKAARSYFLDEILPKIAASIRRVAKPESLLMEAEGVVTAIHHSKAPDTEKINDLIELGKHVELTINQITKEVEAA